MTQTTLQWIGIGVSGGLSILSLAWQIIKHRSDRTEKRREKEDAKAEKIVVRKIEHSFSVERGNNVLFRLGNEGVHEVILERVSLCVGGQMKLSRVEEGKDISVADCTAISIPLLCVVPMTEPLRPMGTRDFFANLQGWPVAFFESLCKGDIWIDVHSCNGHVLRIPKDKFMPAMNHLIEAAKSQESSVNPSECTDPHVG